MSRLQWAVVLAAGRGQRFRRSGGGVFKQLVPYEGVPVIRRLADQLVAAGCFAGTTVVLGTDHECAGAIQAELSGHQITYVVNEHADRDNNLLSFRIGTSGLADGAVIIEADCVVADCDVQLMAEGLRDDEIRWSNVGPLGSHTHGGVIELARSGAATGIHVFDESALAAFRAEGRLGVKMFGITAFGSRALERYCQAIDELVDPFHKYFHHIAAEHPERFSLTTCAMSAGSFSFNTLEEMRSPDARGVI